MKNKPELLKLNIQHFSEFNPDNVLLQDARSGKIPEEQGTLILKETISNSVMMQLAKYEEMTKQKKTFNYLAEGVGAYWVGEGEIIKTSKPQWLTAEMEAKKLGVIVPVSREFLQYSVTNFFSEVRPLIAEAFYKKFDEATILGVDNPFSQSVAKSVTDSNHVVEGELSYETLMDLYGLLNDADHDPNAFISRKNNNSAFRGIVETSGNMSVPLYDRNANTLDGIPIANLKSSELKKGELFGGDFDFARYGIPYNLNYAISEEAQLSSITGEDGNPVNLFERELIAIRATMDVAFMVLKDDAFAKLEPGEDTP
ncbi:phage major capsid protein [Virgibacillus halophilus]|uniref:Phage major capsid protein n=1 Tax=Tigheibacillus halophilus TaxID=361280 RepID=A0ABU5C6G0_9BACI|nr:phage major capsid protein [Virgibacillus halophilus]